MVVVAGQWPSHTFHRLLQRAFAGAKLSLCQAAFVELVGAALLYLLASSPAFAVKGMQQFSLHGYQTKGTEGASLLGIPIPLQVLPELVLKQLWGNFCVWKTVTGL